VVDNPSHMGTPTNPDAPTAPAAHEGLADLLRIPAFRTLWAVRIGWTLGIQMLLVAVSWQMYELTNDAWSLALIGLAQFVPVLAFTLPAGHVADRLPRRRIISACLALQALTAAALAALTLAGHTTPGVLLAASLVLGVARAFQMPAVQAMTPASVPPGLLPRAMAAASMGTQGGVIVGPALGGFLLAAGGMGLVQGTAAALFALGLLGSAWLPGASGAPRVRGPDDGLLAGVRFVRQRPVILGAIALDLFAVLFGGATVLLPLFAKDILGGGPQVLGWLRAAPAIGALGMSLWLMKHPPRHHVGRTLLIAVAVFGLSTVVFGLSRSVALSMLALVVNGAADMVSVVIRQSLVQLNTPDEMRGRVSAVSAVFIGASNQLGEFQMGSAAVLLGPVGAVVAGGCVTMMLVGLWPRWFPAISWHGDMQGPPPR
jgi:MFS family permease